jgi:hypothetical protein
MNAFLRHGVVRAVVVAGILGFAAGVAREAAAAPITSAQAVDAVRSWLAADSAPFDATVTGVAGAADSYAGDDGVTAWHVVGLQPSGYAIVAADDRIGSVIAFSASGVFDPAPDAGLYALLKRDLPLRLAAARAARAAAVVPPAGDGKTDGEPAVTVLPAAHPEPFGSVSRLRVPPLLTARWGHGAVNGAPLYNYYTPSNITAGCVELCMAQTMHRFQFPTDGIGRRIYLGFANQEPIFLWTRGGDGNGGPYRWDLMAADPAATPGLTEEQRQAIGSLVSDAGASIHSDYDERFGTAASLASVPFALSDTFGYAQGGYVQDYGNADPIDAGDVGLRMVNPNLDAGLPVFLSLSPADTNLPNIAVTCDGYGYTRYPNGEDWMFHHLNFGNEGRDDLWYTLPQVPAATSYTNILRVAYNMMPRAQGELISGRIVDQYGFSMPGIVVTVTSGTFSNDVVTGFKGIYACVVPPDDTYTVTPRTPGAPFAPASRSAAVGDSSSGTCGNVWGLDFVCSSHVVAGQVIKDGFPLLRARVTFSGLQTVETDLDGYYAVAVPDGWTGTATPSLDIGGSFAPPLIAFTNLTADSYSNNFTWVAPTLVSIAGTVMRADGSGAGLPGVSLSFPGVGVTVTTDANGDYVAYVPIGYTGTSTVMYADGGMFLWFDDTFTTMHVGGRTYTDQTTDIGNQYYYWLPPQDLTIEGRVIRRDIGGPVSNVAISATGGLATNTDATGYYRLRVPYLWTGTVTPSVPRGGAFQPPSRTYLPVHSSLAGQNYTWTPPAPQVSGRILNSDTLAGVAGITVALSGGGGSGVTDGDGTYRVNLPYRGWSGTLLAAGPAGSLFEPALLVVPPTLVDRVMPDWLWISPSLLTGRVTRADTLGPVPGVTIALSGGAGTVTTGDQGGYGLFVPRHWTGTATPSHPAGGIFAPAVFSNSDLTAPVYEENYVWTPPALAVSGRVIRADNLAPVAAVAMTFANAATGLEFPPVINGGAPLTIYTDTNGMYGLAVPYGWSGSVTPFLARGGGFSPLNRSYNDLTVSRTAENFQWLSPAPAYAGVVVRFDDGRGVEGATVVFSNAPSMLGATNPLATVVTASNGYFSAVLLNNWSGTVTPGEALGGTFAPPARAYTNIVDDLLDTNANRFVWRPPPARLLVTADPSTRGTVTNGPDAISAALATNGGWFTVGARVTIVAVPNQVSRFVRWENGDTNRTRTVVLPPGGTNCVASFTDLGPVVAISGSLDFGDVVINTASTRTVRISNKGTAGFQVLGVVVPMDYLASPASFSLPPGAYRDVLVRFLPTVSGLNTGLLQVATYPAVAGTNAIAVRGRGMQVSDVLGFYGNPDFGDVLVNQRITRTITVTNLSRSTIAIRSYAWRNGTDFSVAGLPMTLAPRAARAFTLTFAPRTAKVYDGVVLTLATGAGQLVLNPSGTAHAAVAGTWTATLGGRNYTLYLWQGMKVVDGRLTCRQNVAINDQYVGTLFAASLTGALLNASLPVGSLSLASSGSSRLSGTVTRPGIGSNLAVTFTRTSTTVPSTIPRPVRPLLAPARAAAAPAPAAAAEPVAAAAAAPSALRVTLAGFALAGVLHDGAELLAVELADDRLLAFSPALTGSPFAGHLLARVEPLGADADADGLPDGLAAALGAPVRPGLRLLAVRLQDGSAVPEAVPPGLLVEGGVVPLRDLPAVWTLVPAP